MTRVRALLCGLLGLCTIGHLVGTFLFYPMGSETFVWSLSGAGFALSVIALNIIAASDRPGHLACAAVAAVGWAVVCILFGLAIGAVSDPRVLAHLVAALGLMAIDVRQLVARRVLAPA